MSDINKIKTGVNNFNFRTLNTNANTNNINVETINLEVRNTETFDFNEFKPRSWLENPLIKLLDNKLDNPKNIYYFLEPYGSTNMYGVDQGAITNLVWYEYNGQLYSYADAKRMKNDAIKNGNAIPLFNMSVQSPKTYNNLKNKLIDYGFNSSDAEIVLNLIDDAGACSYAATCNDIFHQFSNDPILFKKTFGYDMYITTKSGKSVLNSHELLLDLYLFANDKSNGGLLWENGKIDQSLLSGEVDPLGRGLIDVNQYQHYMSNEGKDVDMIDKFLKSKNESLEYTSSTLLGADYEFEHLSKFVLENMENGKSISLDYFYHPDIETRDTNIRMQSYNENYFASVDTATWDEGGGHSVQITGVTQSGFVVSSWGSKYHIPYSDLNLGENSYLYISDISTVSQKGE